MLCCGLAWKRELECHVLQRWGKAAPFTTSLKANIEGARDQTSGIANPNLCGFVRLHSKSTSRSRSGAAASSQRLTQYKPSALMERVLGSQSPGDEVVGVNEEHRSSSAEPLVQLPGCLFSRMCCRTSKPAARYVLHQPKLHSQILSLLRCRPPDLRLDVWPLLWVEVCQGVFTVAAPHHADISPANGRDFGILLHQNSISPTLHLLHFLRQPQHLLPQPLILHPQPLLRLNHNLQPPHLSLHTLQFRSRTLGTLTH